MNGFSHKPARVVRRAYLASTRQHQQENENPARRQSQTKRRSSFRVSASRTPRQPTGPPKAENLGQIERKRKAFCVPGCRVAERRSRFSSLKERQVESYQLVRQKAFLGAGGRLPKARRGRLYFVSLFSFSFFFGVTHHHYCPTRRKKPSGHGHGNKQQPFPS